MQNLVYNNIFKTIYFSYSGLIIRNEFTDKENQNKPLHTELTRHLYHHLSIILSYRPIQKLALVVMR